MHITHKLRLEFLWQNYLNYIISKYFLKIIGLVSRAVGNLALKHISILLIKPKDAFVHYERAKEAVCVESFQSEKEIADFYKELDAPPEDYVSSKGNIGY